jgi:hypothetical protein
MPFDSAAEAVKSHPNLSKYSAKAQRAFVHAFNSAYESGKDEGSCFAIGYSAANQVDGKTASVRSIVASELMKIAKLIFAYNFIKLNNGIVLFGVGNWPKFVVTENGGKYHLVEIASKKAVEKKVGTEMTKEIFADSVGDVLTNFTPDGLSALYNMKTERESLAKRYVKSLTYRLPRDIRDGKFEDSNIARIVTKSEKDFSSKNRLLEFFVLKEKMHPESFVGLFGPVDVIEEDSDEVMLSNFKYDNWDIQVEKGIKFDVEEAKKLLDIVSHLLASKGLGYLSGGKVLMIGSLAGNRLADYSTSSDLVRIGVKKLQGLDGKDVRAFLHELAHRDMNKFMSRDARSLVSQTFYDKRHKLPKFEDLGLVEGDILIDKMGPSKGDEYEFISYIPYERKIRIKKIKAGGRREKSVGSTYTSPLIMLLTGEFEIVGKRLPDVDFSKYFPTPYSTKSDSEWYAELFSFWTTNKLSPDVVSFLEEVHR